MSDTLTLPSATPTELPAGWRTVRFGDVVRFVKTNADPIESGLERYVAGEHMETDNLHIRRWGTIGDGYLGPAFHRKFVAGQVLYGSRRTYLRKVAVADFDGICANTTFVLEPSTDELIPELLPFIMQTEAFTRHSVEQSKGSVNPYINWSDLTWFEFALPPLNEQRRIADIMWALDESTENYEEAQQCLNNITDQIINKIVNNPDNKTISLGDILIDTSYGTSQKTGSYKEGLIPVLRIPNVINSKLDLSDITWSEFSDIEKERFSVNPGDILLVRTNGNPNYVGRCAVVDNLDQLYTYASYLIRLRVDISQVLPEYLGNILNSTFMKEKMRAEIKSSAGNYNINTKGIKKQIIPLVSLDQQKDIIDQINNLTDQSILIHRHMRHLFSLKRQLLNNFQQGLTR
jgi:type I restriction enzyme, S subunit